jgi:hypothetical protein
VKNKSLPGSRLLPVFFTALLGVLLFIPAADKFIIEQVKDGRIVYCTAFKPGMEFAISYIHSVNKSKIIDIFTISGDGIITLDSSRFTSFGAGVASFPEEKTSLFSSENGYIDYKDICRVVDDLVVFVGTVADHEIILQSAVIPLNDLAKPQTNLRFRVKKISAAEIALYNVKSIF